MFLIECGDKTYGAECKEPCGNCKNMEPCHHVDGSCPSGCDAGVYGKTCVIGSTISLSKETWEAPVVISITIKSL